MISLRDHAQRPRVTRAKSLGRPVRAHMDIRTHKLCGSRKRGGAKCRSVHQQAATSSACSSTRRARRRRHRHSRGPLDTSHGAAVFTPTDRHARPAGPDPEVRALGFRTNYFARHHQHSNARQRLPVTRTSPVAPHDSA
jgi:hypothetical protein